MVQEPYEMGIRRNLAVQRVSRKKALMGPVSARPLLSRHTGVVIQTASNTAHWLGHSA
jgi:hypothetical protein